MQTAECYGMKKENLWHKRPKQHYRRANQARVASARMVAVRPCGKLQLEDVIIEQKAVSRIELGERLVTDYELLALAKVLKVSVMWLLTGEQQ